MRCHRGPRLGHGRSSDATSSVDCDGSIITPPTCPGPPAASCVPSESHTQPPPPPTASAPRTGDTKRALALAKDFRVPEAALTLVRIRALASARDWPGLTALSNERKPPVVGFAPFAAAAAAAGAAVEARKFAARVAEYEERVELLLQLGAYTDAAEAAGKAKDVDRLRMILQAAPTSAGREAAERALAALGAGGGGRER